MNFLPGWFPGPAAAADTDLTSITQVLSATSQATTIAAPSGIQAGDLLVLLDFAAESLSIPTAVVPSGFSTISNVSDASNTRQIASYKLAAGTEGGNNLTGMSSGTLGTAKALYVFRGNAAASSLVLGDADGAVTGSNPAAQTISASAGQAPLVVFGFYGVLGGRVNPRTFTVSGSSAKDGELNSLLDSTFDIDIWIAYKIYNASPADVVVDMDDEGFSNALQSCYIEMA